MRDILSRDIETVFRFINECNLGDSSRAWNKADMLTLLVETYELLIRRGLTPNAADVARNLIRFYEFVNRVNSSGPLTENESVNRDIQNYHSASVQASNDRSSPITRGDILRRVMLGEIAL